MQIIGLIGGMSWESSAAYYAQLNRGVEERLGGLHSARIAMASVDFAEVTEQQDREDWDAVAATLSRAGRAMEQAGADFLLLCTTTFHRVAEQVEAAVDIPLVHLGDVVAKAALEHGVETVGFVGTTFSMSRRFFTDRIASHGLNVITPYSEDHAEVNRIIYEELVHGQVEDSSRRTVTKLIDQLWAAGAGAVVLGCTELELLVDQSDVEVPLLPCTTLHVEAALDRALG